MVKEFRDSFLAVIGMTNPITNSEIFCIKAITSFKKKKKKNIANRKKVAKGGEPVPRML